MSVVEIRRKPEPEAVRLSVAVLTRNRPEQLRRTLQCLATQTTPPFEVLVSDDSDPEFAEATRKLTEEFGFRYLAGPGRGLYANRNQSALACRGTHIRSMDDDHTFAKDHIALCLEAVQLDPSAIWTTGEIGFIEGRFHDRAETAAQLHPSGVGGAVANWDDNWSIADGSTIYPRQIFERGFRMVEEFPYGSSYLEFGAFLYAHGYRSRCIPGAFVEHHAGRETLTRANDFTYLASCLFASLCYNLYFKPNGGLAMRYVLSYAVRSRQPARMLGRLPSLRSLARKRWRMAVHDARTTTAV